MEIKKDTSEKEGHGHINEQKICSWGIFLCTMYTEDIPSKNTNSEQD